jgi:hypothetical protein
MSSPSGILTFPHPTLKKLQGQPANKSLQLLQKQLYANTMAICSTREGGENGHLALVMPAVEYNLRTGGIPFEPPIHPGIAPIHGAAPTQPQVTETNRAYTAATLTKHKMFSTVGAELKKQVLQAVEVRYLTILEDPDMGFTDVTVLAMIAHLKTEYGTITNADRELNRADLSAKWNPDDDPIEDLWKRIQEAQRYSIAAGEAITDATAIRLTLPVFEETGLFLNATDKWRETNEDDWTMPAFQLHFKKANKERMRKLTAQTAGYHGAHAATALAAANAAIAAAAPQPPPLPQPGPATKAASQGTGTIVATHMVSPARTRITQARDATPRMQDTKTMQPSKISWEAIVLSLRLASVDPDVDGAGTLLFSSS